MSGMSVYVCSESGERLTTPIHLDGKDQRSWVSALIPAASDVSSPCWRFIDLYGDTTFNRLQIPAFIEELDGIMTGAGIRQRGRLAEIRALAEFALALPHRYLKFCGD